MKKVAFLLLFLGITFNNYSQKKLQSSNTNPNNLVQNYKDSIKKLSIKDYKKALDFSKRMAIKYLKKRKIDVAIQFLQEGLLVAKENKNSNGEIMFNNLLGQFHARNGENKKAKFFIKEAISIAKVTNDTINLAKSYYNLGKVLNNLANYNNAIDALYKSYTLYDKKGGKKMTLHPMALLGIINTKLGNNDEAISNYNKAMQISLIVNDSVSYFRSKKNLAVVYKNLKDYKKSIAYNLEVATFEKKSKSYRKLGTTYNNLGTNYLNLKVYDSAKYFIEKSVKLKKAHGSKLEICSAHISLGNLHLKTNSPKLALSTLKKALREAYTLQSPQKIETILELQAQANYEMRRYKKAFDVLSNYNSLSDSISSTKIKKNAIELQTKYQTQQKETKILKLSNQNNIQKASLAKAQLINISGASILVLLSGLALFFYYKRKQKQKLEILKNTIKTAEKEKQRIGKELHDGIASTIIKLVYETEGTHLDLSDKLLKTYNEVRNLSHQLDNTAMHNELFVDRVLELVPDNFKDRMFTISIEPNHLKLEEPYGTHFYRIIQELITNNLKHSKASQTSFRISNNNDLIKFTYKDNGIGIKNLKKGNGFNNIEDRIELMKGKLNYNLEDKEGMELTFSIPYKTNIS